MNPERIKNIMLNEGLDSPEKLALLSNQELLRIPGVGRTTLAYIRNNYGGEALPVARAKIRPPPQENFGPGSLGCHEAFHTAFILSELVNKELCHHPAVILNPTWRALADDAFDKLDMLYVAIGKEHG